MLEQVKRASVVIPTYNDAARLQRCLAALDVQTLPRAEFEVVVVDNGSTDQTSSLREQYGQITWCYEPKPGSYSARNTGIRAASGDVIAFTDSDCVPSRSWLKNGLQWIESGRADIIGGRISFLEPAERPLTLTEICESQLFYMTNHKRTIEVSRFAVTANLMTRRCNFERIGPFDERLKSSGDREWVGRALAGGLHLAYADDVSIQHPRRNSIIALGRKIRRLRGGMLEMAIRNPTAEQLGYAARYTIFDYRLMTIPFRTPGIVRITERLRLSGMLAWLATVGTFETVRLLFGGSSFRGGE